MAPKKTGTGNSPADKKSPPFKSTATVRFTSSATIDAIVCPDDTIEVLGYVDALQAPRVVGAKGNFRLFKFVLNNGSDKRIQCLAWQNEIDRVASVVEMNKIIHLNGAVAKEIAKPMYNTGNVPFELSIQQQTSIDGERGFFRGNSEIETQSTPVEWSELGDMEGRKIEISGFLKMAIKMTNHKNGDSAYGVGAITNGKTKLAIRVASFDNLPSGLTIGCAIKITGVMNFDRTPYVQVSSIILEDKDAMNTDIMHEITCTPKKKARKE